MWYIIRHGETAHNVENIWQGHYPSVLNIKGITQSRAVAKKLQELEQDFSKFKFIASPLLRARQTIQIIMHLLEIKTEAFYENLLLSRSKGIYENLSKNFINKYFPEELRKHKSDYWDYIPPSGESRTTIYGRITDFLKKYKNEKKLIVVLHGSGSTILRGILEKKPKEAMREIESHSQNYMYQWNGTKIKKIKLK